MNTYRDNYETLPDAEGLGHVTMNNDSEAIDYKARIAHVQASQDYLTARAKRMAARVAQRSTEE
ncbi:hypothetical protein [Azospirillum rugosum]|uniref:Uncharacterized protein n=1 Tax=Azospirillum rugosum TaxID=416170 RepID=A0ABS4SVW6_9PROT|nr:hypothetical protein [Azospirillum rugosum]MBP2296703.1 hypothetical protein [Azospirillum rugosum]MDQ0530484.1 hypothetical protein [Azospirillum rugosum]